MAKGNGYSKFGSKRQVYFRNKTSGQRIKGSSLTRSIKIGPRSKSNLQPIKNDGGPLMEAFRQKGITNLTDLSAAQVKEVLSKLTVGDLLKAGNQQPFSADQDLTQTLDKVFQIVPAIPDNGMVLVEGEKGFGKSFHHGAKGN